MRVYVLVSSITCISPIKSFSVSIKYLHFYFTFSHSPLLGTSCVPFAEMHSLSHTPVSNLSISWFYLLVIFPMDSLNEYTHTRPTYCESLLLPFEIQFYCWFYVISGNNDDNDGCILYWEWINGIEMPASPSARNACSEWERGGRRDLLACCVQSMTNKLIINRWTFAAVNLW